MRCRMAAGEHDRHRPGHLYQPEEGAQCAAEPGTDRHGTALLRLRQGTAQQPHLHHGQPVAGRGEDHYDRHQEQWPNGEERGGVVQRAAPPGVLQRGRMGRAGQPEHAAFRHRLGQRSRPDGDGRLRRHRAERDEPHRRGRHQLCHHHERRPGPLAAREGACELPALLQLQQGDRKAQVQPLRHGHGAEGRHGCTGHQAGARLAEVADHSHRGEQEPVLQRREDQHRQQEASHALRPGQLHLQLQPQQPNHRGRDHHL